MADDPKSLSQDDIDALINQVSPTPAAPKASSDATPAKAPAPAPAAGGALGQDDIDALINQIQPTAAAAPAAIPAIPAKAVPVAPTKPTVQAGALGQDDIDALINQVQQSAPAAPKPPAPAATTASLDQDDIDALINGPTTTAASAAPTATLDQDAIDALINPPTAATTKPPTTKANRESSITQMLDSVQDAAKAKAQGSSAAPDNAGGPLGQDDIDRLLSELGSSTTAKAGPGRPSAAQPSVPTTAIVDAARSQRPGTTSSNASAATVEAPFLTGPNAPTLALSAEDLDALVDRQVGVTSDHQEVPMIDQLDIDALVKQLANATGAPDTRKISDALAKHEGEIDKLLGQAGDAKVTMDAIPMASMQGSSGSNSRPGAAMLAVPVMGPAELKGTRWLLAAAVLFLAVCSFTLGLVVNAINGLSLELKTQHQSAFVPSNSFADDYKAAITQLSAPDAGEVAKGVVFMARLKSRHPGHEAEIALSLGRHFRGIGAFRQAAEEFAALSETGQGMFDDPRIFLDYAACLSELGDLPAAARQVYLLLANEDRYLSVRDHNGLTRPADEVARNQQAVQDAYLTLGRMLAATSQQSTTRATASTAPAPAHAGHGGH